MPGQEQPGEFGLNTAGPAQAPPDRGPVVGGDEVSDRPPIARQQDDQMGMQPVSHPSGFADQIHASLDQEPQLGREIRQADRWQAFFRAVTRAIARASPGSVLPGRRVR